MSILEVKDSNHFKQIVLESNLPVLVDFWAEWCQPCKAILPYVEAIAQEEASRLKVVKVNIDDNGHIASEYGVRGIPTLILFHQGKELERTVGSQTKSQLISFINMHIS